MSRRVKEKTHNYLGKADTVIWVTVSAKALGQEPVHNVVHKKVLGDEVKGRLRGAEADTDTTGSSFKECGN